jgi:regulatory protein
MDETEFAECFAYACNLLGRRAYSVNELRVKLQKKEYEFYTINAVVQECLDRRFLDDYDYAQCYLNVLKARNYGLFKIKMYMKKKGLEENIVEQVLEEGNILEEELDLAKDALQKKLFNLRNETDHRKLKEKCYRFLASRGFRSEIISQLISEI